ncbi:MAG: prolyl oligopeptidase family serine peptidase [Bacteroidota bacterium]
MNKYAGLVLIILTLLACEELLPPGNQAAKKTTNLTFDPIPVSYPQSPKDTTVRDDYHGKTVEDPYRWLESEQAVATKNWVKAQNQVTFGHIDQIPYRDQIEQRLKGLWNYERFSTPFKAGEHYYYFRNNGLQNQSVLYRQNADEGEDTPVLDPNTFSEDGTAALGEISFSKNGRWLAYEVSEGGADWRSIYIKDLQSGELLEEVIQWVKFSDIGWSGKGFFYSRYPPPEAGEALSGVSSFQQVFYHRLGTPQSEDELVFADRSHPNRNFIASTTKDERFLGLSVWESTSNNNFYFKNLQAKEVAFSPIVESFKGDFFLVDNLQDKLLLRTNYKAPNWRLIAVSSQKSAEPYWQTLIPNSKDVLQSVDFIGGKLVCIYLQNAISLIRIYDTEGLLEKEIRLPEIGTISNLNGSKKDSLAYFSFSSFTRPATIYQLNLNSYSFEVFKAPKIDFDADAFECQQVWYKSYDGEEIPMFIVHRKGLKLDGKRPTLLYGYGGFDISILPNFNLTRLNMAPIVLENDGIFAVANLRGGGEFGKAWHQAGTKGQKQNVFNDFQAAAEYLIDQRYTQPDKLAIYGRSNGGLLVGACMTQRPDLYGVALPAVGVLDMLRYQNFTIGRAWAGDYGLSENPAEFDYLIQYSPLHNIEATKYPATLVTTADHDDRVVPAHSYKFAANLQENQQGEAPTLIRIESSAGHGAGKPVSKRIDEAADVLSFMFYHLKENVSYSKETVR